MKIAIVSVTKRGAKLGQQVRSAYIQEHVVDCYEKENVKVETQPYPFLL